MAQIYITDEITDPAVEKLILGDMVSTQFDPNARILLSWNQTIDAAYMQQFTQLTAIIRCGIGYDLIDIQHARARGIAVSNVPDYCIDEVADTTLAFILNIIRGVSAMDQIARKVALSSPKWQEHLLQNIRRTNTYTVGIVGAGRIGSNVISKLAVFGIKCLYFDPFLSQTAIFNSMTAQVSSLHELLQRSDIVSLHVPLNAANHGIVDENFLNKMQYGSSLINTARGKLIKDIDLIYTHLRSGRLAYVAFDVLPTEPPLMSKFLDTWQKREIDFGQRVLINPHAAFYSQESVIEVRQKAAFNALGVINGKPQLNIIQS